MSRDGRPGKAFLRMGLLVRPVYTIFINLRGFYYFRRQFRTEIADCTAPNRYLPIIFPKACPGYALVKPVRCRN